jgi:hypothetical protein
LEGKLPKNVIEREIGNFLSTKEPEVLCITGKWGVGKTFSWKRQLNEARGANTIGLSRYAYVSLFGVNTLDELKYAIFENTVAKHQADNSATPETLRSTIESAEALGRKNAWVANLVPGLRTYFAAATPAFFLSVRNQLICIDDLERKGKGLNVGDVLGLVSFLKEERGCKIVLLLNDEAFSGDVKTEFSKYLEKVVDVTVKFAPSPKESTEIALTVQDESRKLIASYCSDLGISNIRIIKKIERFVLKIEPTLRGFDKRVLKQAVHSITLLGWSVYSEDGPTIEFLRKKRGRSLYGSTDKEELNDAEKRWDALLDEVGFGAMDEFDFVLLDGINKGFFEEEAVSKLAAEMHANFISTNSKSAFEAAWRLFHDSFDNNEEKVVQEIMGAFRDHLGAISPLNLNGTVRLLKELGRRDDAASLIKFYVTNRAEGKSFFDLTNYPFIGDVTDPDVIEAFQQKYLSFKDERSPLDVVTHIVESHGWSAEDTALLSTLTAAEFVKLFKSQPGRNLSKIVNACLQFDRLAAQDDKMKLIVSRVKEALRAIGAESTINKIRVKRYGVDV